MIPVHFGRLRRSKGPAFRLGQMTKNDPQQIKNTEKERPLYPGCLSSSQLFHNNLAGYDRSAAVLCLDNVYEPGLPFQPPFPSSVIIGSSDAAHSTACVSTFAAKAIVDITPASKDTPKSTAIRFRIPFAIDVSC